MRIINLLSTHQWENKASGSRVVPKSPENIHCKAKRRLVTINPRKEGSDGPDLCSRLLLFTAPACCHLDHYVFLANVSGAFKCVDAVVTVGAGPCP